MSEPRNLFGGYDTFTGKNRAAGVTGKAAPPSEAKVLYRASVCKSITEVQKSLTVSGGASVAYGPISADAKASYVDELSITATSVAVVVYVADVIGTTTFDDVSFSAAHPTPGTVLDFYLQYGDSWIDSVTTGSEYWATYVFYATSQEEQNKIAAELNGSASWGTGTKIDTHISTAISKLISESQVASKFDQAATGYAGELPDEDGIISFAQKFPGMPKSAPTVVAFTTSGYEHAPKSSPTVLAPLSTSRERFMNLSDPLSPSSLTGRLSRVESLANQATALKEIYGTYGYTGDAKLAQVDVRAAADLEALRRKAKDVAKDPVTPWEIPDTPSVGSGVPELNMTVHQGKLWGGGGGGEFQGPQAAQVRERWKLTQIRTRSGDLMGQITLTWTNPDGTTRTQQQGSDWNANPAINLAPDEYVASVIVRSGTMVDHLQLFTSKGQIGSWGGNGGGEQEPVTFSPNGKVFLGFHGRSGTRIDALGVIWAEFSPAIWNQVLLAEEGS